MPYGGWSSLRSWVLFSFARALPGATLRLYGHCRVMVLNKVLPATVAGW
jgi:hypothetical protein